MHAVLVITAAPEAEDVVAGWTAFGLFGLGILAVALLGFSLVKRLKNVDRARDAGLYDPSTPRRGATSASAGESAQAPPEDSASESEAPR